MKGRTTDSGKPDAARRRARWMGRGAGTILPAASVPLTLAVLAAVGTAAPAAAAGQSVISTGITGQVTSTGMANPQYVLSFIEVQRLLLEAAGGPVTASRVSDALNGIPVTLQVLEDDGLLAPTEDGRYRLSYLLLTRDDQQKIYEVTRRAGADLASSIAARRADFDAVMGRFTHSELHDDLLFGLVAGFLLNWQGLKLGTDLGYRVETPVHPNGDRYLVHSTENGAHLDSKAMYWGSHTYPGPRVAFTTFGDGPSQPRLNGIPDVYTEPLEAGLEVLQDRPQLYNAVETSFLRFLRGALDPLGDVMLAVSRRSGSAADIATATGLDADAVTAHLNLLEATGYVTREDGHYDAAVVVLTEEDRPIVEGALTLGRDILTTWLKESHGRLEGELSGISPMNNGVPFDVAFSEVWHYVFGFAAKDLVAKGFYADPYAAGRTHVGFVPVVWPSSFHLTP